MLIIGTDLLRAEVQVCDLYSILDEMADNRTQLATYVVRLEAFIEGLAMYADSQNQVALAHTIREGLDKIKKEYGF